MILGKYKTECVLFLINLQELWSLWETDGVKSILEFRIIVNRFANVIDNNVHVGEKSSQSVLKLNRMDNVSVIFSLKLLV